MSQIKQRSPLPLFVSIIFTGFLIGCLIPLIFVSLDLSELEMEFSLKNVLWVLRSQRTLSFSAFFFPIATALIGLLVTTLMQRNKELKFAHQEVLDSRLHTKRVLDSLSDMVLVIDLEGTILEINYRTEMILGQATDELIGHNIQKLFKIGSTRDIMSAISIAPISNWELEIPLPNQTEIPVLFSSSVLGAYGEGQSKYVINLKDIRDMKELQDNLEKERSISLQSAKLASLGEMAAGIAHEINNPLTIINTSLEILSRKIQKDQFDKEKFLELIDQGIKTVIRISKLVKSMRELSRDSSHDEMKSINLKMILEESLILCQEKVRGQGIDFIYDESNPTFLMPIVGNQLQLSQVILNLLGNASDAVKDLTSPWIKVDSRLENDRIIMQLIDSGPGIPEELIENIFKPFFSTKEIGHGTGLGLSISRSIIEQHNGKLWLDRNNPNTCFCISFPLKKT